MALAGLVKRAVNVLTLGDGSSFPLSGDFSFGDSSGLGSSLDERSRLSTVYRAIQFLAGTAAILPIRAYRKNDDSPVDQAVLTDPDQFGIFTAEEWREHELRCRLIHGNSYSVKLDRTSASPWPRHLAPLDPTKVQVIGIYDRATQHIVGREYLISRLPDVNKNFKGSVADEIHAKLEAGGVMIPQDSVFHVAGQNFNGIVGMSPLEACMFALNVEVATEKAAAKFYSKGQLLSGILRTEKTLDVGQADTIKKQWAKKMGGIDNAYDIAVLDRGAQFQPLSISPEQAQFLQMRQFNVEQVARIFGVPPFLLMASAAGNAFGTGLEQQLTATDIFTLSRWLRTLEGRVTMELLPNTQYARFDKSALDRVDTKDRHAAYSIARKNGYMSVNEIRKREGLEIIDDPDADDPMLPVPTGTPANQPGGNSGAQGGGSNADLGQTDPNSTVG